MHTAYTHQWRLKPSIASFAMASCHSIDEAYEAQKLGFRAFIALESDAFKAFMNNKLKGFTPCPAPLRGTTCTECKLCDGKQGPNDKRSHIVIEEH